ncbi:amidohydrolase [Mesorhizobium sp. 1B3]|uniref:amidohydrolase n=1 Tax=Mesorhizobium sp. 1B3 TaxID=3243599 RepID=UPI003D958B6D
MWDNSLDHTTDTTRRSVLAGTLASTAAWMLAPSFAYAEDAAVGGSAKSAYAAVESVRDAILRISREVWKNAELSLHEEISSEIHLRELREAGFTVVSTGTSGIPTAFIAEWTQGEGGPTIGFLPEYDALPGLGNAAEPRQTPGPTGVEVGHGCGHNMLGAGCTGAAFALKKMMIDGGHPGTIRVYGCAAEETEGAKVYMARDGLFNDLDACLAWHPGPMNATGLLRTAAVNMLRIRYTGRTAHAGVDPWEGRSALKGAELFGTGIQFMREHLKPTTRMHYVYTDGGGTPNVIPDTAEVLIMIRDQDRAEVNSVTEWVKDVANGAATSTQTEVDINHFFGLHDLLPNETLVQRIHAHMSALELEWTNEEQEFAKACQREMGLQEAGLMANVMPPLPEITTGGGTDVGDVSYNTPTGLFALATMPIGVGLHTWPVTACGGMSIGDKSSIYSAIVMAGVGYDLMIDADLRAAAKADFERRKGGRAYVSPLPEGKARPEGIPPHLLLRDGSSELGVEFNEDARL